MKENLVYLACAIILIGINGSKFLSGHAHSAPSKTSENSGDSYRSKHGKETIVKAPSVFPDYFKERANKGHKVLKEAIVLIATTKPLKVEAAKRLFQENPRLKNTKLTFIPLKADSHIAEQPLGIKWGRQGAINRLQSAKQLALKQEIQPTFVCAIENFFTDESSSYPPRDHAFVAIEGEDGQVWESVSDGITIDPSIYKEALKTSETLESGCTKTIGSVLQEKYNLDGSDWFSAVTNGAINRQEQIFSATNKGWF